MNDKQKLAAMGAQYRLTEEQAKALAERMPKAGVLQILDDEPLCMAKRIEELEAQARVMAELLAQAITQLQTVFERDPRHWDFHSLVSRIDAALAGKLPNHVEQPLAMVPEDWVKGKYFPLHITTDSGKTLYVAVDRDSGEVFVGGDAESSDAAKHFLWEIGALSPVVVPKGWQLVPVEPTESMIGHGCGASVMVVSEVVTAWAAMLAAAPKPEAK